MTMPTPSSPKNISAKQAGSIAKRSPAQRRLDDALLEAAKEDSATVIDHWIKLGANPQAANRHGNTALMVAVRNQNWGAIDVLLPTGDGKRSNKWNETALISGVGNGESNLFARMIDLLLPISDPSHANKWGDTALFVAARSGEPEAIAKLLAVSEPKPVLASGVTLLMAGDPHFGETEEKRQECLRLLLGASDVAAEDNQGLTALMHAVSWRTHGEELFAMLLPHCDPAQVNSKGKTAFDVAMKSREWWAVEALAEHASAESLRKALRKLTPNATPVAYARAEAAGLALSVEKAQSRRGRKSGSKPSAEMLSNGQKPPGTVGESENKRRKPRAL